MDIFTNFETKTSKVVNNKNGTKFNNVSSFTMNNIPLSLANSIRRSILSNIPTVAFSDEWCDNENQRSIVIKTNTSGIHNEFLSHRISLVPLYLDNDVIKVKTYFDVNNNKRVFVFKNSIVPNMKINIKNDKATRLSKNIPSSSNNLIVTNNDFEYNVDLIEDASDYPPISELMLPDMYTGDHIILDILKSNVLDDQLGEEINVISKPTIGVGKTHARYCPVGTVSFQLEVNENLIDSVFQQKLNYMNKERVNKNLSELSESEVVKIRKSFDLLDKDRIFKKNGFGDPNCFKFNIESIGFLESNQILYDALTILDLKILDILNSMSIDNIENKFNINIVNDKLEYYKSADLLDGFVLEILDENHTVGNLIGEYLKSLFVGKYALNSNILSFAGYIMPHPLKEKLEIKMKLNEYDDDKLIDIYNDIYSKLFSNLSTINIKNRENLLNNVYLAILVNCLCIIHRDIAMVKRELTHKLGLNTNSFEIEDNEEYFNVFSEFPIVFNTDIGFKKITNIFQCSDKVNIYDFSISEETKEPELSKDDSSQVSYLDRQDIIEIYGLENINYLKKIGSEWTIRSDSLARIQEYMEDINESDIMVVKEIADDKVLVSNKNNLSTDKLIDITIFLRDFKIRKVVKLRTIKKKKSKK